MKIIGSVARSPSARRRALELVSDGWTVDLVESPSDPIVAVVSRHGGDVEALDGLAGQAWAVEERPQWDDAPRPPAGRPVVGVKQISFLYRAPGLDRPSFAAHWTDVHAPLARIHHPALWRYRQNIVVAPLLPGTPDIDGIAELGMRLRLDFTERMYDSPDGMAIVGADVRTFLDLRGSWRVTAREHPPGSTPPGAP